jgi:hypothetical protein
MALSVTTYTGFQALSSSEKVGLVILEASKRLMGWAVYSGSVYSIAFTEEVITQITDSGAALTAVASIGAVTAGKYYLDRSARTLYLRTSDSVNPNGKFIACTFRLFFSNAPVTLAYDLSSGFELDWLPMLKSTSSFGVELDNRNLIGFAIEGSGKVTFYNDQTYWKPRFDKYYFENQRCFVYSWTTGLAATEAKLIYRGRVQTKDYSPESVSFGLKDAFNELRSPVPLSNLEDVAGALIPEGLLKAKQRLVYGYVKGLVPANIDQVLEGYEITGTVTVTAGLNTVTGSGTTFLSYLSPDDQITIGSGTTKYTVQTITSNTALTVSETFTGDAGAGQTIQVIPSSPRRWANRVHLIAGHELREPATTVVSAPSLTLIEVASSTDFQVDDEVYIGSEVHVVQRISGNFLTFVEALAAQPAVSDPVTCLTLQNVYLNDRKLTYSRDFTYDATTAEITLDPLAEFNVAPVQSIPGTITFTNASRTVTGSGSTFKKDLKVSDWIRATSQSAYFEILSIESDTSLTLRSNASYSVATTAYKKSPAIVDGDDVVLSLDTLGATEDGTSSGTFISSGPKIVKDLLTRAGLSALLNTASFTASHNITPAKLGLVIPDSFSDTEPKSMRDTINRVNQSIFGSLYQNENFELEYSILRPTRTTTATAFDETDILRFTVESDSSTIAKTATVLYRAKEWDPTEGGPLTVQVSKTSNSAQYLAGSTNEKQIETLLVDDTEAQIYANRWAFILEVASSIVKFETKLQAARLKINEKIYLTHEKFYERVASSSNKKIAAVSLAKKTIAGVQVEIDDIANSFSRCATITPTSVAAYASATETEKMVYGYITDTYGMQANAAATYGTNLIW